MFTHCKRPIKIRELFIELALSKARVYISIVGLKNKLPLTFSSYSDAHKVLKLHLKEETKQELEKKLYPQDNIKCLVKKKSVLFESTFLDFEKRKLLLEVPKLVSFYNRRQKERITPVGRLIVVFNYSGRKFERECLDISLDGLSFLFTKQEVFKFKRNDKLRIVIPQIRKNMVLNTVVTNVAILRAGQIAHHPYGGIRVSIHFQDVSEDKKKGLALYIEDEEISRELSFEE